MSDREYKIENAPIFALNLRLQRKLKKYTQNYMAEQLNVTRATYGNYERGYTNPTPDDIIKCTQVLECDFNTLFDKCITERIQKDIRIRDLIKEQRVMQ